MVKMVYGHVPPFMTDAEHTPAVYEPSDEELSKMQKAKEDFKAKCNAVHEAVNNSIDATLTERGNRYGSFIGHSCITQDLKTTMVKSPKWNELQPDMKESLEMIQHKIGRILNGDPYYHDSWHDIVGYAKLVADRLEK